MFHYIILHYMSLVSIASRSITSWPAIARGVAVFALELKKKKKKKKERKGKKSNKKKKKKEKRRTCAVISNTNKKIKKNIV